MNQAATWQFFTPQVIDVGVPVYQLIGFFGLLYLLWRSQIRRRPAFLLPIALGWLLVLLGAGLRIMHWPLSTVALAVGAVLQWLPYALWTWQRRPISVLTGLKLAWLTTAAVAVLGGAFYLPAWREAATVSVGLFWAMLLYGLYQLHMRQGVRV